MGQSKRQGLRGVRALQKQAGQQEFLARKPLSIWSRYGISDSLPVQFDTFQNSETSDPSSGCVSVYTGATGPNGVNNLQYSLG